MSVEWPTASAAVYPNSRSAAVFHKVIVPSRSCATMASSDDDTIAARYASAGGGVGFDIQRPLSIVNATASEAGVVC